MIRFFLIMTAAPAFYVGVAENCIKIYETKAELREALKQKYFPGCLLETAQVFEGKSLPVKIKKRTVVSEVDEIESVEVK